MNSDLTKNDIILSRDKIYKFLEKEKQPNIDYLCNFRFDELRERDRSYGEFRAERDEDSFWLTKYINFIIYNNKLPKITTLNEMNEYYGGDTINPIKASKWYLTLGNFMLLPKCSDERTTFNTFRYSCFRDDLYKFILKMSEIYKYVINNNNEQALEIWLNKEGEYNETWKNLAEKNSFYFEQIDTFEKFVEINLLDGWTELKNNEETFIKNRGEKICDKLKKILKDL